MSKVTVVVMRVVANVLFHESLVTVVVTCVKGVSCCFRVVANVLFHE